MSERIQLIDLKTQYLSIKREIDSAIKKVLDECRFVGGESVTRFEKEFAEFCGTKYAVAVGNGTDALVLVLKACGIGPGDEVVTVPYTFIATVEAITRLGAAVRFVDIDERTYNIDVAQIEAALTERTKAIIPIHLYGQPADMDSIDDVAARHNLTVIEDAAQAHGAEYKDKKAGSLGHAACFSFYPSKNLGAYGDGGAVVTNDHDIAEKVRLLRDHGRLHRYEYVIEGFNSRLDALQASILLVKLRHLDRWNECRRNVAAIYTELFNGVPEIMTPCHLEDTLHVYHLYVIRTKERDMLRSKLDENGISTAVHYPVPLHLQPAYQYLKLPVGSFPVSEKVAEEVLSLPMYPELSRSTAERIAATVKNALSR